MLCRDSSCMTQTVILGMGAQFHRYVSYRDHDILFLFLSFFPLCLFTHTMDTPLFNPDIDFQASFHTMATAPRSFPRKELIDLQVHQRWQPL